MSMINKERKLTEWPEDKTDTVRFEDLVEPVVQSIGHAYTIKRRNAWEDIPYNGYNIGWETLVCCPDPLVQLNTENIELSRDQGNSPMHVLVGIAVQLGIEQGIRIERKRTQHLELLLEVFKARLNERGENV